MRLLPILCASWTLAAALEGRQASTTTDVSSRTRPTSSSPTTLATETSASTTSTAAPTSTQTPSDSSSDTGTYTGAGDGSGGDGSGGSAIDTDGGASGGSSGSFNLSKGGLIAICIVVALVVVFGIVSTVLFIVAKRRQWNIRASIRRASRRFTGRGRAPPPKADRQSKRAGVQMASVPATKGHQRGLVVEVQDVEKGRNKKNEPEAKLWRNDGRR